MPPIGYRHREAPKSRRKKRNAGRRKTRNNTARKRSRSRSISLYDNAQDIQQYLQLQEKIRKKTGCCVIRAKGFAGLPVHCRSCKLGGIPQVERQEETCKNVEEGTEECEVRSPWEPCNTIEEDERDLQVETEGERDALMRDDTHAVLTEEDGDIGSPFRRRRQSSLKHETCGNAGKLQCGRECPLICGTVLLIPSILMTLLAFTLYGRPIVPLNIIGPVFVSLCFLVTIVGAVHQIMSTIKQRRRAANDDLALTRMEEELLTEKGPESDFSLDVLLKEDTEPDTITDNAAESAEEVETEDDDSDSSTDDGTAQTPLVVEVLTSSLSTDSTVSADDICFIDETETSDSMSSSGAER
ncbi:hypothetical protein Bbelb_274730 [Branchiostoma belcheri]|nr:hypothetical protein Bbelb_274730 [Branchiostoma belcheri]